MNYTTTWTLNVSDKVSSSLSIINEKGRKTAELVERNDEIRKKWAKKSIESSILNTDDDDNSFKKKSMLLFEGS